MNSRQAFAAASDKHSPPKVNEKNISSNGSVLGASDHREIRQAGGHPLPGGQVERHASSTLAGPSRYRKPLMISSKIKTAPWRWVESATFVENRRGAPGLSSPP